MKIVLKQTEAQCLTVILNAIPSNKITEEPKDRYRALTKRKKILKELSEKNSEFLELAEKAITITTKYRGEYQAFLKEIDEAENIPKLEKDIKEKRKALEEATEEDKKEPIQLEIDRLNHEIEGLKAEKTKALKEQEEILNKKITEEYEELGIAVYQHFLPQKKAIEALYAYKDETLDKEIEIELSEEHGHKEFIAQLLEEKALEFAPSLEEAVLVLGEKFGI